MNTKVCCGMHVSKLRILLKGYNILPSEATKFRPVIKFGLFVFVIYYAVKANTYRTTYRMATTVVLYKKTIL